jgi:mutual gliding-motility protein MglA
VVFVADSTPLRANDNIIAWHDMKSHLMSNNLSLDHTPIVLQCNKQDTRGAMALVEIKYMLHVQDLVGFPAIALNGEGVLDTLKAITRGVITKVQHENAYA